MHVKIATSSQMAEIDKLTITKYGVPGIILMENAAIKVVNEIKRVIRNIGSASILVIAGKGNNGGDAFAVARLLHYMGAHTAIYIAADKTKISGDAKINMERAEKLGVKFLDSLEAVKQAASSSQIIVDGIFGTGFRGEIQGSVGEVIDVINNSGTLVLSIDIPSGVNGENGEVASKCVTADVTVTFGLAKLGHILIPGCFHTGRLVVEEIGFPDTIVERVGVRTNLIALEAVTKIIPKRYPDTSKKDYGKSFIITGSTGMTGAGALAGTAALRTGAGLVCLGVPQELVNVYDSLLLEAVTIPLDSSEGKLSRNCLDKLLHILPGMSAAAIGPGLSQNDDIKFVVRNIIENSEIPLVVDADALNAVADDISIFRKAKAPVVITPHVGEMARLSGLSVEEIGQNRIKSAKDFSMETGTLTVLKGARTVVASPDGEVFINTTGNSGMATAGTGDVLTGVITSLIAQGTSPLEGAIAGVYLHGLAGDIAADDKGEYGMIASDLAASLPYAIKRCI